MLSSCATGYKTINPSTLNYSSGDKYEGVELEYKYSLLDNKYAKKETSKSIRVIAIKITNNTDKDIIFGKDFSLSYTSGNNLIFLENEQVFSSLKQNPVSHLLYLLLTPLNLYTYRTNTYGIQETTNSIPIGFVIGPGLAFGNLLRASTANSKFKNELLNNNIMGRTIKKGETISGLISVRSSSYDAIKINKLTN